MEVCVVQNFGIFAQGANHPVVDVLLMCALKSLVLWVFCIQQKKPLKTDFGLPVLDYLRTQAINLGHGCILRMYAYILEMMELSTGTGPYL